MSQPVVAMTIATPAPTTITINYYYYNYYYYIIMHHHLPFRLPRLCETSKSFFYTRLSISSDRCRFPANRRRII